MRSKALVGVALSVALMFGFIGVASAGEITGGGKDGPKPTPIASYENPNSICAFSGQNDVPDGSDDPGDPFAAGRVQSFGDIVQQFVREFVEEPAGHVETLLENKPGINCNKNRAPAHGE